MVAGSLLQSSRIPVSNMDASLRFYRDALGLIPVAGFRSGGAAPVLEVFLADRGNRRRLTLTQSTATPAAVTTTGHAALALVFATPAEREEVLRRVWDAGYEVTAGPLDTGGTSRLLPVDPDGHLVEVTCPPDDDRLPWSSEDGEFPVFDVDALPDDLLGRALT